MPMGQMPVLEVDGHRVHQSISMARYVARRVGLGGTNDWENLIIDTAVDTVNDFRLSECIFSILLHYANYYLNNVKKNPQKPKHKNTKNYL